MNQWKEFFYLGDYSNVIENKSMAFEFDLDQKETRLYKSILVRSFLKLGLKHDAVYCRVQTNDDFFEEILQNYVNYSIKEEERPFIVNKFQNIKQKEINDETACLIGSVLLSEGIEEAEDILKGSNDHEAQFLLGLIKPKENKQKNMGSVLDVLFNAVNYLKNKNTEKALDLVLELKEETKVKTDLIENIYGVCLLSKPEKAQCIFEQAVKNGTSMAELKLNLCVCYLKQGMLDEAVELVKEMETEENCKKIIQKKKKAIQKATLAFAFNNKH